MKIHYTIPLTTAAIALAVAPNALADPLISSWYTKDAVLPPHPDRSQSL